MKIVKIFILVISLLSVISCEDPVPNDYQQHNIIEALLIVEQPIRNIKITKTLPLNQKYSYDSALIRDAMVFIYEDSVEMELLFKQSDTAEKCGYYYTDTNYLVKKNTKYNLKIVLPSGEEVTGTTTTPDTIAWIKQIDKYVQYPFDTLNLPNDDRANVEWTPSPKSVMFYVYSLTCLDTLEYGKYLENPTQELNNRTRPPKDNGNPDYYWREWTVISPSLTSKFPFMWRMPKWFGRHSLKVYAPDANYSRWLMYVMMAGNLSDKANSVTGCDGFFGSAYLINDEFVLLKNK